MWTLSAGSPFPATAASLSCSPQAGAILKAEVYGIPRPEWAADAAAVGAAAAKVVVPEFVPKKGIRIETDPKAENPTPSAMVDDESVIDRMVAQLQDATRGMPAGFKLQPVQFEKVGRAGLVVCRLGHGAAAVQPSVN